MSVKDSIYIKTASFIPDETLYNVANCKLNGIGMEQDEEEAVEILKILAERGYTKAMKPLADYYRRTGNDELADRWIKLASARGDVSSKIDQYFRNEIDLNEISNRPLTYNNGGQSNLEALVKKALPHVVMIYAAGDKPNKVSTGSGFILDGGIVITNNHVVGDRPHDIFCVFEPSIDTKKYNLIPLALSHKYDLAVLAFEKDVMERMAKTEHLKIRTSDLQFGENVCTIGSPLGLGLSVSHGIVSNPRCTTINGGWPYVIQTDMSINHGNSGGAMLDKDGNVVGVSTFILGNAQGGLSFGSPTCCLIEFLNEVFK